MKSFEEISKMNLAELDRPAGAGEEELETETTGAAGNHSVSDAEKAGTPGADDLETSINMSAAVSDNEEEKQPEELEKKVMMEPQGKHYRIDGNDVKRRLFRRIGGCIGRCSCIVHRFSSDPEIFKS